MLKCAFVLLLFNELEQLKKYRKNRTVQHNLKIKSVGFASKAH